MQSAKRIVLAEMSPDNNPFLLTPPRVIKCGTELLGYILNKVYLNNGNDNKIEDKRQSTKDYDILITAYFWAFLYIHNIIFF